MGKFIRIMIIVPWFWQTFGLKIFSYHHKHFMPIQYNIYINISSLAYKEVKHIKTINEINSN